MDANGDADGLVHQTGAYLLSGICDLVFGLGPDFCFGQTSQSYSILPGLCRGINYLVDRNVVSQRGYIDRCC